jgi:uncharacterized membrane protein YqhA
MIVPALAVLLLSAAAFLIASIMALGAIWDAIANALNGDLDTTELTVEFLDVVSALLKAVVFYLVGIGLYSLFVAPLNLSAALGVETLSDLETKVTSVVILIMAILFLEHFIRWENPRDTLQFGGAFALVVVALVAFQVYNHIASESQKKQPGPTQAHAQHELHGEDHEAQDV